MKEQSIKKNYIYSLIFQILSIVIPLITTPYLARTLGADGNGVYSLTFTNVSYFTLVGVLGLGTYGQLEVAKVKDDVLKRSRLFFEIMLTRLISHIFCLLAYIVLIIVSSQYKTLYMIQISLIFASMLDLTWFFQGIEEFKRIAVRNIIIKILSVALIFLFVRQRADLIKYTIIMSTSTLLSNICFYPSISRFVNRVDLKNISIKQHVKGSFFYFLPTIASVIMSSLDKTMIGVITNSEEENGYYYQAYKIETLCMALFSSLNLVMRSRMAYLFKNKDKKATIEMLNKSLRFVSMISFPISLGTIAISKDFVPWFFGDGYDKVAVLLPIFAFWLIFKAHSNCVLEQYLTASGRQNIATLIIWIGAMFNAGFNLVLIYYFQSIGAAIASVGAEFLIFILVFCFSRNFIPFKNVIVNSLKYLSASLAMCLIVYLLGVYLSSNMFTTILQICLGAAFYFLFILVTKDDMFMELLRFKKK